MTEHTLTAVGVVMDCTDPVHLADFWQQAMGFDSRSGDGDPYIILSKSSLRRPLNHLTLQRVPEPKAAKNRTHLDLFAVDVAAEVERLVTLGAAVAERTPEGAIGPDLYLAQMTDPEGHEFCLIKSPRTSVGQ